MGIDVYKIKKGSSDEFLFTINDSLYKELTPAFNKFQLRTGLFIDPYSDLKLTSGLKPLIEALEETTLHKSSAYNELISILNNSEQKGFGLIFLGD